MNTRLISDTHRDAEYNSNPDQIILFYIPFSVVTYGASYLVGLRLDQFAAILSSRKGVFRDNSKPCISKTVFFNALKWSPIFFLLWRLLIMHIFSLVTVFSQSSAGRVIFHVLNTSVAAMTHRTVASALVPQCYLCVTIVEAHVVEMHTWASACNNHKAEK